MSVVEQWAKGTKASDGFTQHPVGDYPGVITTIKQNKLEKTGQYLWNLSIKTAHGNAQFTIWGISEQDIQKANSNQADRDKLLSALGRHKRLFVDLGVFSKEDADTLGWMEGDHSVIGSLSKLLGRACNVHIETSANNPKYQNVYINAPQAVQNSGMDNLPVNDAPNNQASGSAGMNAAPPFPDDIPSPLAPPPSFG